MTVKELIEELTYYNQESEVIFEIDDELDVERWSEDKYGFKTVDVRNKLKPSFIWGIHGDCRIELEVERE